MKYIKPEYRAYYREKYQTTYNDKVIFSHEDREFQTAKMHRFNLFKRLDSSVAAFHLTLQRLTQKIDAFINTLQSQDGDISAEYIEDAENPEDEAPGLDYKYDIKVSHLMVDEYLRDLNADRHLLTGIIADAKTILHEKRDHKLHTLRGLITEKVTAMPYNPGNRKILIFSAFADTALYLYQQLAADLKATHDLTTAPYLLQPDHTYTIELIAAGGRAIYRRDGEVIFDYADPNPLIRGWFGFRTVNSAMRISSFEVHRLAETP
jgi:ERCC4-related helicase